MKSGGPGLGLVFAVCVVVCVGWAIDGSAAEECGGHGEVTNAGDCACDPLYYGPECGSVLVRETATLFCLTEGVNGTKEFCFTLYPLDCKGAASVNLVLYTAEGVPMVANKYLLHADESSADVCSRTLADAEASCIQEKACLRLEEATLEGGSLSADVSFLRYCGSELQRDSIIELGSLTGETSLCGAPGTLYPPAVMEVGDVSAQGIEVDDSGCVVAEGLTLFCPIVLMDPCAEPNAVLISGGEVGFSLPLTAGLEVANCHPRACIGIDDVEFLSDGSVSLQLNITDPSNPGILVTYSLITATPRECGARDEEEPPPPPAHDYWPLVWEILAAGVMVLLCMGLLVVAMAVVMYRRKHGDPSGYGVMDSDPDSLLEELGDEEAEEL